MRHKKWIGMLLGMAVLALAGCGNAAEKATDVMPLEPVYAAEASDQMPDGSYAVAFQTTDLQQTADGYALTMEFYDYDRYAEDDILNLQEGDTIQVQKETVKVKTVELEQNETGAVTYAVINGGIEEGGFELTTDDIWGGYRTVTMDDYPLYYSIGSATLPISRDMTLQDCSDYETLPDGLVTTYADLPGGITENANDNWNMTGTEITVRDGQIVQIIRHWTP